MASVSEEGKILRQETRKLGETKKGYTYFERNDVLLAKITPCFENGKAALASDLEHPIGFGSTEFHVLRPDPKKLDAKYLFYLVWSRRFRYLGQKAMTGAAGQRRVPTDFLKNYEIPLPPLDDQKRIAHLLGKVEGLIARRKQHLQQLDDLLKSVFLEMFGDPVRNEKGWERTTIGELATEVKYGTSASAQGGPYKYLRMNNITQEGHWDFDSLKYIDVAEKDFEKYSLRKGDLVFNRTNSKELVGKTAVYDLDEPVIIAGYLIRVRFDEQTNPWFVWGHLNSRYGKTRLFNLCRNIVGMANINAKELQAIPILNPPSDLQNQFAAIVEKVEGLKSRYQQSLTDLESLYGALSQKAFKGELDLSRVLLPAESPEIEKDEIIDVAAKHPMEPLFELPAPKELTVLQTADGRKSLLDNWLNVWLGNLGEAPFSAQAFMEAARLRLWDLAEDDAPDWGVAEYDELKFWVFEALEQGRLKQDYDDTNNRVQLKGFAVKK